MIVRTVIVGTKHRGRDAITAVAGLREGDVIVLKREPENDKDSNAVTCHFRGVHLGFVPMRQNGEIAAALDAGATLTAVVAEAAITIMGGIREAPRIVVTW